MKANSLLPSLVVAAVLLGCSKPQPRHVVILPDVSASIDRAALKQAFTAIDDLVSHLDRGDKVTIIPILGNAQAEASGRIMRFEVPARRQAYDADVRSFRTNLNDALRQLQSKALANPEAKTDIFGSVLLAEQELEMTPKNQSKTLIILSDFVEDDSATNFKTDTRLANQFVAKQFGRRESAVFKPMKHTAVYLGVLRSIDAGVSPNRRQAIEHFWTSLFHAIGASPTFATDGPGLLRPWWSGHE